MATVTLGTAATTSLTALAFNKSALAADIAAIAAGIKDDQIVTHPIYAGAFGKSGQLYVPNRGMLIVEPGDFVAFDPATGWPILLSAAAAAGAQWVHS